MADDLQNMLNNPEDAVPSNEEIIQQIDADNEKDYLTQLKGKNKNFLLNLSNLERERIAKYIIDLYNNRKGHHKDLCDKIDKWDEVFRMMPHTPQGGDEAPNYRSPLSTVTLEVVHANIMNVIFTPKEVMRVLPTEENDVPKVKKLATFGNWSMDNELDLFAKIDRLFHSSAKNGECPWMMDWVKEYGTEIIRKPILNPADQTQPLIDPDTQEVLYQEIEESKLLYNGPRLTVFSRKDYIQPENAVMGKVPEWELIKTRFSYDTFLRETLQGRMYKQALDEITEWSGGMMEDTTISFEDDDLKLDKGEKEFLYFYGRMRVNVVKEHDAVDDPSEYEELEDEFIAIVEIKEQVLCQFRKNKFPLKERPVDLDFFIPDDEGRRRGLGATELMDGPQTCYDSLFNQFLLATIQANNPFGFFTPMGNMRNEPLKIKNGYIFPTSDPSSVNIVKLPSPDGSLKLIMDTVNYWAQLLFGISEYAAGLESSIDPGASGRKVQEVIAQGSVRLNIIIKRKNETLKKIFRKWFLLYKDNMPPNKFMRIAGDDKDNPWKFEKINYSDFALKSIPDFELTGNVLNANKALEAQKRFIIYDKLVINPFFMPQTTQGLQALHSLTQWLIDGIDDNTGLSRMIPSSPGENVHTPEEENARFMQGDEGMPTENEDHVYHISVHNRIILDPNVPQPVKEMAISHNKAHIKLLQQVITQQLVFAEAGINPQQGLPSGQGTQGEASSVLPTAGQGAAMGGF